MPFSLRQPFIKERQPELRVAILVEFAILVACASVRRCARKPAPTQPWVARQRAECERQQRRTWRMSVATSRKTSFNCTCVCVSTHQQSGTTFLSQRARTNARKLQRCTDNRVPNASRYWNLRCVRITPSFGTHVTHRAKRWYLPDVVNEKKLSQHFRAGSGSSRPNGDSRSPMRHTRR